MQNGAILDKGIFPLILWSNIRWYIVLIVFSVRPYAMTQYVFFIPPPFSKTDYLLSQKIKNKERMF